MASLTQPTWWKEYKDLIEQLEKWDSTPRIKNVSKMLQVLSSMSPLCQYNAAGQLLQDLRAMSVGLRMPPRFPGMKSDMYNALVQGNKSVQAKFTQLKNQLVSELTQLQTSLEPFRIRKYDSVVCIGFLIGVPGYGDKAPGQYHGYDDDIADIDARWTVMEQAIDLAHQGYIAQLGNKMPAQIDDNKVLKIFMAPEFYFRGKRGAYDVGAMPYLCEKARKVTGQGKFADWLFVLGSCVCSATEWKTTGGNITEGNITGDGKTGPYTVNKPTDWKQKESDEMVLLDNYAIVQKGGIAWGQFGQGDRVVLKQMRSRVDFGYQTDKDRMTPVHLQKAGAVTPSAGGKYTVGGLQDGHYTLVDKATDKTDERGPYGCIFDLDGITFGLEVCLDHFDKRLVNSPNDKSAIRIQLIPSWGAYIVSGNHITNGIIFNVDGAQWLQNGNGTLAHYYPGTAPWGNPTGDQWRKHEVVGPNGSADVFDGKGTWINYFGPFPIPP